MIMAINSDHVRIVFENVSFRYENALAVDRVSFVAYPSEHVALLGANGSGKSTILSLAAGILRPTSGTVHVATQSIALVVQRSAASDRLPLTVRDTVEMGRWPHLGMWRRQSASDRAIIDEQIERLGIAHLAKRQLGSLSGGQRQRALVAQALAQQPDLLILDEPATGLDASAQHRIHEVIAEECARGVTVLHATHDLTTAHRADTVLDLSSRATYQTPAHL